MGDYAKKMCIRDRHKMLRTVTTVERYQSIIQDFWKIEDYAMSAPRLALFMAFLYSKEKRGNYTMRGKKKAVWGILALLCILACSTMTVFAADEAAEYVPKMYASFWALVPPIVAIVLALITKEVYSSLFVGILIGGIFYSGFTFEKTITHVFQDGIVGVLSDSYNVGILVFLVVLGIMVCMMNKAGGSAAFGRWASTHIKSRVGAQLATIVLGVLIFIDDYFNCLTVGSVMRPVTDKHNVSQMCIRDRLSAVRRP